MSEVITEPGVGSEKSIQVSQLTSTSFTTRMDFQAIKNLLSDKPLRRPSRFAVQPVDNQLLIRLAERNPPADGWFENDEPCPF